MTYFLSRYLSSMRRIFVVMIAFGLAIGAVFPYLVTPFVTWDPERMVFFRLASLAAGFLVGSFCSYLVKVTLLRSNQLLAERKKELETAKERFSSLTRNAIRKQEWVVSYKDSRVPACWQIKDCEELDCPAYGRENLRCWLLAGTYCGGKIQGPFAQKLADCSECEVYRAVMDNDPIREIGENFNSLMLAVREKEDLLSTANAELKKQYMELELLHQQAREMADTDLLTGLRNHAHFQQHLRWEAEKALSDGTLLTLIMFDLDNFKAINDRHGHQMGDKALKRVGGLLKQEFSKTYAARYGGDEFMMILPELDVRDAASLCDRLREKIGDLSGGMDLPPGSMAASFGIADLPQCAGDADSLIAAADSALLFAKRRGRNCTAYFRDLSGAELTQGDIDHLQRRLEGASIETIRALAEAVDVNDSYAGIDAAGLERIAASMATGVGMAEGDAEAVVLAAKLHDIGKIGVPASILNKSEKLSTEELTVVKRHPEIGERILREARQLNGLISAILYHHERWDGKGYPERLQGKQIPVTARIVGIIDAYRAMLSDRPYRKALTGKEALEELRRGAGSQFDPELVEMFIRILGASGEREPLRPAV